MSTCQTTNYIESVTQADIEYHLERCEALWSLVSPYDETLHNWVQNGSFESNLYGWQPTDQIVDPALYSTATMSLASNTPTESVAYHGAQVLRLDANTPGKLYGVYYSCITGFLPSSPFAPIDVPAGETWQVGVWVRGCQGDVITLTPDVDGVYAGFPYPIGNPASLVCDGSWQRLVASFVNQAPDPVFMMFGLICQPASNACTSFFVDAAIVSEQPSDYFDGNMSGASWQGNPNGSVSVTGTACRSFGKEVYFRDMGLKITSWSGHGLPPVINDVIANGQYGGSFYRGTLPDNRGIVLGGIIESCGSLRDLYCTQSKLGQAMNLWNDPTGQQYFWLRFRLRAGCDDLSPTVEIPVSYVNGLTGATNNSWRERIALELMAYENVFWRDTNIRSVVLQPGVNEIPYNGTAPAQVRIDISGATSSAGVNVDLRSIVNETSGIGAYFTTGVTPLFPGVSFVAIPDGKVFSFGSLGGCTGGQRCIAAKMSPDNFNYESAIARPQSRPSEFALVPRRNGINKINVNFAGFPLTPTIKMYWHDAYASATDIACRRPR